MEGMFFVNLVYLASANQAIERKEVSNEDRDENEKLLEKIENDDDVQNVFHNMKD